MHTPGPWKLNSSYTFFGNGTPVASMIASSLADLTAEEQANARLIAAAPDLLQALKDLLAVCDEELDDARTPEMRVARRIIAKAEGQ